MRYPDELKFLDTSSGEVSVTTAGTVTPLNLIIQGDDYNQREGRRVDWKSLLFRCTVTPLDIGPNGTGDIVRLLLVWDLQSNGAVPAVNEILQSAVYDSPMNLNYRDRFVVIADKFISVAGVDIGGSPGIVEAGTCIPKMWQVYKKLNATTTFSGTAAAIGSMATGTLHLLAISRVNLITAHRFWSRLRFTDP